jgi:3-hydroxyacyl-[acyl-carrier-protein] dehydratase
MRFILIDRILNVEKNKSITALKNVTLSDEIFIDHFPGNPIFPGALIIEALSQAGGALVEISNDFKYKAIVFMVERAKYRDYVRPGDQLILKAEIINTQETYVHVKTKAVVNNKTKVSADLVFSLLRMEDFFNKQFQFHSKILYEIWLKGKVTIKNNQ